MLIRHPRLDNNFPPKPAIKKEKPILPTVNRAEVVSTIVRIKKKFFFVVYIVMFILYSFFSFFEMNI